MNIVINGAAQPADEGLTIAALLREQGYDQARVAVALNEEFVPRPQYDARALRDGDRLEIVKPMQGG
jgi:sulfur carrier protein